MNDYPNIEITYVFELYSKELYNKLFKNGVVTPEIGALTPRLTGTLGNEWWDSQESNWSQK